MGENPFSSLPRDNYPFFSQLLLLLGGYEPEASANYSMRQYPESNDLSWAGGIEGWAPQQTPRKITPAEELQAAHIAARLPILAVMGAELKFPQTARDGGAAEVRYVVVSLDVKWSRAVAVVAAMAVAMLTAIVATTLFCRGVLLRDENRFLSLARLMRDPISNIGGKSVDSSEQLAALREDMELVYGAKQRPDGYWEVCLAPGKEVVEGFPVGKYL